MVTVAEPVPLLLERDVEQARLSALLEQAHAGSGAVVTISGPAGIGKTQLLAAVHRLAGDRGSGRCVPAAASSRQTWRSRSVASCWNSQVCRPPRPSGDGCPPVRPG